MLERVMGLDGIMVLLTAKISAKYKHNIIRSIEYIEEFPNLP